MSSLKRTPPVISVIIPVYNVEIYIKKCLESVINQTFGNSKFELLIIDDGSTDKSLNIVKKTVINQPNVKVIENVGNIGLGPSRNKGINLAEGEYLYFIDGDDYIDPETLENLLEITRDNSVDIVTAGYKRVGENGRALFEKNDYLNLGEDKLENLAMMLADQITHTAWGKLVRKSLFTDNNIEYPVGIHEDVPVTYRLFWYADSISKSEENTYNWVQRKASITSYMSKEHIDGWFNSIKQQQQFVRENFEDSLSKELISSTDKGVCKAGETLLGNIIKYESEDFEKRVQLYEHLYNVLHSTINNKVSISSQRLQSFNEIFSADNTSMKKAREYEGKIT